MTHLLAVVLALVALSQAFRIGHVDMARDYRPAHHIQCSADALSTPPVDELIAVARVGERGNWHRATDMPTAIAGDGPEGRWLSFPRPLPNLLDPSFLEAAADDFNREQLLVLPSQCVGLHCNDFALEGSPFVVALHNAFVDHEGLVYDDTYSYPFERLSGTQPLAVVYGQQPERPNVSNVTCVDKLLTILQPYQENYYHFVVESLPRLIMARDIMLRDPSVRLLTRAHKPFIRQFLHKLGIPADRIETLGHAGHVIRANTVYVPTPTKIFAPPKENILALYNLLAADVAASGRRNLVIYTSRAGSWARDVINQKDVLLAIRAFLEKTELELVVFDGSQGVEETIALFKRAIMVIGPHGAGMTNQLWTPEGTKIVEFMHMTYPLLCYWHIAAALGHEYWMLPVPQSAWAGHFDVDVEQVIGILRVALRSHLPPNGGDSDGEFGGIMCPAGWYLDWETGRCALCRPGTYSPVAGSQACLVCPEGTYADHAGATRCRPCSDGSSPSCQPAVLPNPEPDTTIVSSSSFLPWVFSVLLFAALAFRILR